MDNLPQRSTIINGHKRSRETTEETDEETLIERYTGTGGAELWMRFTEFPVLVNELVYFRF